MPSPRSHSLVALIRLATLLIATLLGAWPFEPLHANEAQARICSAGLGLGQAEARLYLFGSALDGLIPEDQSAFIATNLSNAAAEIEAAEALFDRPFSTEPMRQQAVSRLVADIEAFMTKTAGDSFSHRAAKIQSLAGRYLSTLQSTFVSSRPDAFQYNSTCDSLLFNACYFYGKATIASAFDDNRSRYFEAGAIGAFRNTIGDGLAIAMDADGHLPPDGHAKKICCTFGTPTEWKAMASLKSSNSPATYAETESMLLGIVADASGLDPVCTSREVVLCASSPNNRPVAPVSVPPAPVPPPDPTPARLDLQCPPSIPLFDNGYPLPEGSPPFGSRVLLNKDKSPYYEGSRYKSLACSYTLGTNAARAALVFSVEWVDESISEPFPRGFSMNGCVLGRRGGEGIVVATPAIGGNPLRNTEHVSSATRRVSVSVSWQYVDKAWAVDAARELVKKVEPFALPCP